MSDLDDLIPALRSLQADIDRHITRERVRRYLSALVDTPAPSTFAAAMRLPVLRRLLNDDGALDDDRLHLHGDFGRTGSPVILTGSAEPAKPLWYFAHLDTISYLVQPADGETYPLVPFCAHMIKDGEHAAHAYRYDIGQNRFRILAVGHLVSQGEHPSFVPSARLRRFGQATASPWLRPTMRIPHPVCSRDR